MRRKFLAVSVGILACIMSACAAGGATGAANNADKKITITSNNTAAKKKSGKNTGKSGSKVKVTQESKTQATKETATQAVKTSKEKSVSTQSPTLESSQTVAETSVTTAEEKPGTITQTREAKPSEEPTKETSKEVSKEASKIAGLEDKAEIGLDPAWKYAGFSKINSGKAILYKAQSNRKNIVIAVNAGHGTKGGEKVKTQVHPDGSAKVTGGTTKEGATTAVAVSSGMTFANGTSEAAANLKVARSLKDILLARGFDVIMIRDGDDVQLDNIARTVIANNMANAHVAVHFDSTGSDKGAYYMAVADNASYKAMEPVSSNWKKINALGDNIIAGLKARKVKIFGSGSMGMDLTQTSYSTIPSVVVELGDKTTDYNAVGESMANGIADGIETYFAQ